MYGWCGGTYDTVERTVGEEEIYVKHLYSDSGQQVIYYRYESIGQCLLLSIMMYETIETVA